MGAGVSTLQGVNEIKLEELHMELSKPVDLSDVETNGNAAKDEIKKIRKLFNESGLKNIGSDEIQMEARKSVNCADIADDGKSELIRLRSLLQKMNEKEILKVNRSSENFVDKHFPPNATSICINEAIDESIAWKRLCSFIDSPMDIFPDDEPTCNSVKQSAHLGNCYFIATLCALCERKEYIKYLFQNNTIEANKIGRYSVKIFHAGRFHDIIVDDYFPIQTYEIKKKRNYDKNDTEENNIFTEQVTSFYFGKNKKNKGLWVPLLEKAYAKVYKAYGAISGGDIAEALRDLTGSPVFSFRIDRTQGETESGDIWNKLCIYNKKKDVRICICLLTKIHTF
jgi:hypothetical protein